MVTLPTLVVAFLIVVAMIFFPVARRLINLLVRLAIFAVAVAIVAAGITMLVNNETIFEKPGIVLRVARFTTRNTAATSLSGSGLVTCDMGDSPVVAATPAATPAAAKGASQPPAKKHRAADESIRPAAITAVATPAPLDDVYPELIRRNYPGIPRQRLFALVQDTVKSLGGWKIVKANPATGTVDCVYTSRYLKLEDDVRITVQPGGEVDVCSRSGTARPGATTALRYFPGDLGANIGHIKDFYESLEPRMDQVYKEEQDRENAKKPH